jgi:hypothetical protein
MTIMPSWFNYYRSSSPEPLVNNDFPSMPFPIIRSSQEIAEVISAEALSISSRSKNPAVAINMLEYFTGEAAHSRGLSAGAVSFSFISGVGDTNSVDYRILSQAQKLVLWFDGIANGEFSSVAYTRFKSIFNDTSSWKATAKVHPYEIYSLKFYILTKCYSICRILP